MTTEIMSRRIQKELEMLPYPVEVQEPNVWMVNLPSYRVKITFPSHYPFQAPYVEITSPISIAFYLDYTWGAATRVQSVIEKLEKTVDSFAGSVTERTRETVKAAKQDPKELQLVMGAYPGEDHRGRSFYEDSQIYCLDQTPVSRSEIEYPRYLEIDFTNHEQLGYLAAELPKRFKTICFDQSTVKFFETKPSTLFQRLVSLKGLLRDDGEIVMELPGCPGGMRVIGDKTNYYEIFLSKVQQAGFHLQRKQVEDLAQKDIIREVFLTGSYTTPKMGVLILRK